MTRRAAGFARRIGIGLAVGLVGLLGGYLVATQLLFPAPEPPSGLVETPELLGLGTDEARDRVEEAGLAWGESDSLRHPTAPPGRVLGQVPLPGQLALPESEVRVTVSTGAQRREVPDVEGLQASELQAILEASGFQATVDTVESDLPRGRVVEIDPPAGTPMVLPGEVRITVSEGPARVEMPYLLGLSRDEATVVLDSLGLTVGTVEEAFRAGRRPGEVVEQEPAAGALLERGSAVRLVVGRESPGAGNFRPSRPYDPDASRRALRSGSGAADGATAKSRSGSPPDR